MHHCHLSRVSTYCSMAICILLTLLAVLPASFIGTAAHITTSGSSNLQQNVEQVTAPLDKTLTPHQTVFLQHIFNKYGHKGVMTFEGFEHLLESLGLGELVFEDHDIKLHRGNNASFLEYHDKNHTHSSDGVAPSRLDSAENTKKTHDHADDHDHEHLHMHDHNASVEVSSDSPHTSAYTASKDSSNENDLEEYDYNYQPASTEPKQKCLSAKALLAAVDISYDTVINPTGFMQLCPVIVYELDQHHCSKGTGRWSADKSNSQIVPDGKLPLNTASGPIAAAQTHHHHHNHKDHNHDHKEHSHHHDHDHKDHHHDHDHNDHDHDHKDHDHGHEGHDDDVQSAVWLYSSASVLVISLCGLLSVIMIPIVTKMFYQQLIQFLVALAIGSLTGDALLHLIPHAMSAMSGEEEHGSGGDDHGHSHHSGPVWIGMTAWGGICLFFFAEKILAAISGYREKKMARTSALGEDSHELSSTVGEKLYKHRAGSYHDVTTIIKDINEAEMKNIQRSSGCYDQDNSYLPVKTGDYTGGEQGPNNCAHTPFLSNPVPHALPYKGEEYEGSESTESHTHTHGHGHGHSHTVPKTVSNVAWMVILGDGMHNFSDGLAIGAAFADSVTGGLSTAIAVFCHELPHELGDFAMLLKAGMSIRQAICYNGLSSVLCFLGMMIGVFLGNLGNVTPWIFSATAGSFIYIALVDMVPELSVDLSSINSSIVPRLLIQAAGLALGCGIMLAIALYEPQLLTMLQ